jgi:methyltransferase
VTIAAAAAIIFVSMLAEARVSARHDRALRAAGAVEPPGDVYAVMLFAYPAAFVAMLGEALLGRRFGWSPVATAGLGLFAAAKALKYWAIHTLGTRWTFRVLVPPDQPPIVRGPYRWLRHPNYVAVAGELAGAALWLRAPVAGPLVTAAFVLLMLRRIGVEERALAR